MPHIVSPLWGLRVRVPRGIACFIEKSIIRRYLPVPLVSTAPSTVLLSIAISLVQIANHLLNSTITKWHTKNLLYCFRMALGLGYV